VVESERKLRHSQCRYWGGDQPHRALCGNTHHRSSGLAFALNPTPEQISPLHSHIGGTRFVCNALLGLVKANWDENRAKKAEGITVTKADYLGIRQLDLQSL
jgi:hypothetical protein